MVVWLGGYHLSIRWHDYLGSTPLINKPWSSLIRGWHYKERTNLNELLLGHQPQRLTLNPHVFSPQQPKTSAKNILKWRSYHVLYRWRPIAQWASHMLHGAGIFTYMYPKNQPNIGKYSIHGAQWVCCFQPKRNGRKTAPGTRWFKRAGCWPIFFRLKETNFCGYLCIYHLVI